MEEVACGGAGGTGKHGCSNTRREGAGMGTPIHENQMKGRPDDSLGL